MGGGDMYLQGETGKTTITGLRAKLRSRDLRNKKHSMLLNENVGPFGGGATCTVKCLCTDLYVLLVESITGPMFAFAIVLSGRSRRCCSCKVHPMNHTNFIIYQRAYCFSSLCGVHHVSTPEFLQSGCS
jgi:hypothetical protein